MRVTVAARIWWLNHSRVDGLCPECWLPGLAKLVYIMDVGGRTTVDEQVVCHDCGFQR